MAMGLHDNDVAFFLAADEPATYVQVSMTHPFPESRRLSLAQESCPSTWYPIYLAVRAGTLHVHGLQVAEILGRDHVIWTDNGIAPSSRTSARGGEASIKLLPLGNLGKFRGRLGTLVAMQQLSIRHRRLLPLTGEWCGVQKPFMLGHDDLDTVRNLSCRPCWEEWPCSSRLHAACRVC